MNVLSLFDGISCGQVALNRSGFKIDNYFASEIDEHAIKVTQDNFPKTKQLGDVKEINIDKLPKIDLLLFGFPCQSFAISGNRLLFDDPRGQLFFVAHKILNKLRVKNPNILFLAENVRMPKETRKQIDEALQTSSFEIDSALVSAQNRKRLYWTNIPNISQPIDKKITATSILTSGRAFFEKLNCLTVKGDKGLTESGFSSYLSRSEDNFVKDCDISKTLLVNNLSNERALSRLNSIGESLPIRVRRLNRIERERAQTLPDNYTRAISEHKSMRALGNGWTVDVIAHIFKNIK